LDDVAWQELQVAVEELIAVPEAERVEPTVAAMVDGSSGWWRALMAILGSRGVQFSSSGRMMASFVGLGDVITMWKIAKRGRKEMVESSSRGQPTMSSVGDTDDGHTDGSASLPAVLEGSPAAPGVRSALAGLSRNAVIYRTGMNGSPASLGASNPVSVITGVDRVVYARLLLNEHGTVDVTGHVRSIFFVSDTGRSEHSEPGCEGATADTVTAAAAVAAAAWGGRSLTLNAGCLKSLYSVLGFQLPQDRSVFSGLRLGGHGRGALTPQAGWRLEIEYTRVVDDNEAEEEEDGADAMLPSVELLLRRLVHSGVISELSFAPEFTWYKLSEWMQVSRVP
jgi:hypothetical protein